MDEIRREYLYKQYEQGANFIKHWHDGRHHLLQFIGTYNAAILAILGALISFAERDPNQAILTPKEILYVAMAVSLVSTLVALMGLATEYSTASYSIYYFEVLREIEAKLNLESGDNPETPMPSLKNVGVATNGRKLQGRWKDRGDIAQISMFMHRWLPVQGIHKFFYFVLSVLWIAIFVYLTYTLLQVP